tara:strand:+ start:156 stop:344 length:189 start_codon:yes stop_codon:yes gene_type:complete
MEFFTSANITSLLEIIIQVIGIASMVATLTPNESDNKAVDFVLNVVNMLGANIGKASNDPTV